MGVYLYSKLPSAYQQVEYIQSSGTQYIKIGSSFKTNYKVVIDFQMTLIGGDYIPLGIRYTNYKYGLDAYSGKFKVANGGSAGWVDTISEDTNRHTLIIDKSTATIDGTNYSISYEDYTYSDGVGVFYYNNLNNPSDKFCASNKLYKLDIYDGNGKHIYDLVPCYRKSDSVIGLYDKINDVFYTNQGTGTFTKGSNIDGGYQYELNNAYIGSIREPGANTIAYFPFENDVLDHSGNGVSLTGTNYLTQATKGYSFVLSQGNTGLYLGVRFSDANVKFVSLRYKVLSSSGNASIISMDKYGSVGYSPSHGNTNLSGKINIFTNSSWTVGASVAGMSFNERHHLTVGYNGNSVVISKDGVTSTLYNGTGYNFGNAVNICGIGNNGNVSFLISECICESECWSVDKKLEYYNTTKGNYTS